MTTPSLKATFQAQLPAGITVLVSGDPSTGQLIEFSANSVTFHDAAAALTSALTALQTAWTGAKAP